MRHEGVTHSPILVLEAREPYQVPIADLVSTLLEQHETRPMTIKLVPSGLRDIQIDRKQVTIRYHELFHQSYALVVESLEGAITP